jgi:hypothetical protein
MEDEFSLTMVVTKRAQGLSDLLQMKRDFDVHLKHFERLNSRINILHEGVERL